MDRPATVSAPVPIQIDEARLRLVVYGEPGVGKTTLAMTFPKPFVIDTDDGLISVTVSSGGQTLGHRYNPTGYKDLEGLYWWIKEHSEGYETIVVDSLDELVFTLMDELVEMGDKYDQSKGKDIHPVMRWVPEQAEYGANTRQMHSFLSSLRQLGKHIVVTSGARDKLGEKRGVDVNPAMQTVVNRWASILGELVVVPEDFDNAELRGKRLLVCPPSNERRSTKNRFSRILGDSVVEPTFDALWAPVEAHLSKGK